MHVIGSTIVPSVTSRRPSFGSTLGRRAVTTRDRSVGPTTRLHAFRRWNPEHPEHGEASCTGRGTSPVRGGSHHPDSRASPLAAAAQASTETTRPVDAAQRLINDSLTTTAPPSEFRARTPVPRPPLSSQQLREKVLAIVLAGGPNTINPLARHTAMPAVPFGSNVRLIDVPINCCLASGINKLYVLTQFNSHHLNTYISAAYPPVMFGGPGGHSFVEVLACNQTPFSSSWYRGSAEAVARNMDVIGAPINGEPAEDILVLSGQAVYEIDFERVVSAHRCSGADVTLVTYGVSEQDATRMGVVRTDPRTGTVTSFSEKPSAAALRDFSAASARCTPERPYEASLGIYVFRTEVLRKLLETGPAHFGHDVLPAAISEGLHVHAFNHRGYWQDVHRLRDFYNASLLMAQPEAKIELHNMIALREMTSPTMLHDVDMEIVLVGDGSVLRGCTLRNAVVGRRSYIAEGAVVRDSVLMGNELIQNDAMRLAVRQAGETPLGIGRNTLVQGAVVDANACIGDNVVLANKAGVQEADRADQGYVISDGVLVVLKGAVIPDGFCA